MQYALYADPKIYLALLVINIAVIFVFYLAMSEMTKGKNKNKNLNNINSWWAVLMVVVLGIIVLEQNTMNSVNAWGLLLLIPMVNLALGSMIDLLNNRFAYLRKIGFQRA